MEQRAFAGTAAAFDGDEFAGGDGQIHAFEHLDIAVAHAESLADSAGDENGRFAWTVGTVLFSPHSQRRASTGFILAARMAGTSAPRTEDENCHRDDHGHVMGVHRIGDGVEQIGFGVPDLDCNLAAIQE